jgi:hypothetical protein
MQSAHLQQEELQARPASSSRYLRLPQLHTQREPPSNSATPAAQQPEQPQQQHQALHQGHPERLYLAHSSAPHSHTHDYSDESSLPSSSTAVSHDQLEVDLHHRHAASPPAPSAGHPDPPSACPRWADAVHNATWAVARAFGFQAFNACPVSDAAAAAAAHRQEWVPATAFVAADHLQALLVENAYAASSRGADAGARDKARWARCVWELHSTIFHPYEARWCRLVGLCPRPRSVEQAVLAGSDYAAPRTVHGLLCELALYFLVYR